MRELGRAARAHRAKEPGLTAHDRERPLQGARNHARPAVQGVRGPDRLCNIERTGPARQLTSAQLEEPRNGLAAAPGQGFESNLWIGG